MTRTAGRRGRNVIRRLGRGIGTDERTVMTGLAIVRRNPKRRIDHVTSHPLDKQGRRFAPADSPRTMAGSAIGIGRYVHCRLAWRPCTGARMARTTIARRPLKLPGGMTGFAGHLLVRAVEQETRRRMIEGLPQSICPPRLPQCHARLPDEYRDSG